RAWKVFFALFLFAASLFGAEPAPETWRVWIEPRFMRAPVSTPILDAKRSELVAGELTPEGLTPFPKDTLATLSRTWAEVFAQACTNAAADLAEATTIYT